MNSENVFSPEDSLRYNDADVNAVTKVLRGASLSVVFGRQTMRFEKEIASLVGTGHAVATSSGASALDIALDLLDIGFGDEVIMPGYGFIAMVGSVLRNLAIPVFADISPLTWNLDAASVEAALTSRTRAVIVGHMFGNPAEADAIRALCEPRGIAVIEDCAQALGATLAGRPVGAHGTLGCFSFNEIKNLTTGEGGVIATDDADLAELARVLRLHGTRNLIGCEVAGKSTMTEMEAALGRSQLTRLAEENAQRTAFGTRLSELLTALPGIGTQQVLAGARHVYSRFVLTVSEPAAGVTRDVIASRLSTAGLSAKPVYGTPMYRQPVVTQLSLGSASRGLARSYLSIYGGQAPLSRWRDDRLPVTEEFCGRQLGFIVPPRPTERHAEQIAALMAEAVFGSGIGVPA